MVSKVGKTSFPNIQTGSIQAKESKCTILARKIGKCIKDCILRYFVGWKDLFFSVKKDWNEHKVVGIIQGIYIGSIAIAHIIALAAIIAGIAFLAAGAAVGSRLLIGGILFLPVAVLSYVERLVEIKLEE